MTRPLPGWILATALGVAVVLWPRPVVAQVRVYQPNWVLRGAFGHGVTGAEEAEDGGPAGIVAVERRLNANWWFRVQGQRVSNFDLAASAYRETNADRMSISSLLVAAVRTSRDASFVQSYIGVGAAIHRYRFVPESIGTSIAGGLFVVIGVQFPSPTDRYGGYVEANVGGMGGPHKAQFSELMISLATISAGVRFSC